MKYQEHFIDRTRTQRAGPPHLRGLVKLNPGARSSSDLLGPVYLNRNPGRAGSRVGKYFGMNESCFVARATVGAYCSFAPELDQSVQSSGRLVASTNSSTTPTL